MRFKILLRPTLAIVFGFIGLLIAEGGTPPDILLVTGRYFLAVAFLAFAILGFILPDLAEIAGRAGIAALAMQIVRYLPTPAQLRRLTQRNRQKIAKYQNPLIVDTSALVDGRLAEVVKSGFIFGTFLVIPSVIGELHRLADSADEVKRGRGRRGLDVLARLQEDKNVKIEILNSEPAQSEVDSKLIKLAKKTGGRIVTVDYNLGKVAKVSGITVCNINELANALKTAVLPNQRLSVQVSSVGKGKEQGVGYLDDGTMVVVEGGATLKGKVVGVIVRRVLQTAAGKMIFAKPI